MANVNFNLREPSAKKETPINLVIRWSNKRLVLSTGERIHPKYWEDDIGKRRFQRVKETRQFPEYPEFNTRLDRIERIAKDAFRKFVNEHGNRQPSESELKEILSPSLYGTHDPKNMDLFRYFERFIEEAKSRMNPETERVFSKSTIKGYVTAYRILKNYAKEQRKKIDFASIDLDFYQDYTEYLTNEKRFSTNYIGRLIKTLKTVLNDATERGVNQNMAFRSKRFRVISEESESIYLNVSQISDMFNLDLSKNERLERARDLFLIGCWTGLRFSDFSTIKKEEIRADGFIEKETRKTGERVVVPVKDFIIEIMKRYKGKTPNSLPPPISNQKLNEYIKEVAKMIESLNETTSITVTKGGKRITRNHKLYELVTCHTSRRSFATNLYLQGFPSISIMKITGHRTEKAFLKYIKITPDENAKILMEHWNKKSNHLKRA